MTKTATELQQQREAEYAERRLHDRVEWLRPAPPPEEKKEP